MELSLDIGPDETERGAYLRRTNFPLQPRKADAMSNNNGDGEFSWPVLILCVVGIISFCAACYIFFVTAPMFGG